MKKKRFVFALIPFALLVGAWLFWPRTVDLAAETTAFWRGVEGQEPPNVAMLIGERPCDPDVRSKAISALREIAGDFKLVGATPAYRFPSRQGVMLKVLVGGKTYEMATQGLLVDGRAAVDFERALMTCIGIRRRQQGEDDGRTSGPQYVARQVERFRPALERVGAHRISIEGESFSTWGEVVEQFGSRTRA